jgi:acyl-CoA synthetase (AMP-forming)/AMP-acid ligase II
MPNCEVLILNDDGEPVGPGETGELVVRGANVMQGYWERPEETARVLRRGSVLGEPLLHTGDLFRRDEEDYLYFVGRWDDIIKSRGEKVSPREVENVLCEHPGVSEAAVVGIPDEVLGRAITAVVAPRGGERLTPQQLQRHCALRLEDFMIPQVVEIRSALPKTSNGKVDKLALAAELEQRTAGVSP